MCATITISCGGGSVLKKFEPRPTYRVLTCTLDPDYPGCAVGCTVWRQTCAASYDGDQVLADDPERFEAECESLGIQVEREDDQHWHYYEGDTCREMCIGLAD